MLENFVSGAACLKLQERIAQLLAGFAAGSVRSIFSTREQTRTSDDYFLASGDRISFFF